MPSDKNRQFEWLKEIFASKISKGLIVKFSIMLLVSATFLMTINFISVTLLKNRVIESRFNSFELLSGQLDDILNKYVITIGALLSDTDINAYNQANGEESYLWYYKDVLNNLKYSSVLSQLDCEIALYMVNKKRIFSSSAGISKNAGIEDYVGDGEIYYNEWYFFSDKDKKEKNLFNINKHDYYSPNTGLMVYSKIYNLALKAQLMAFSSSEDETVFLMDKYGEFVFVGDDNLDWNNIFNQINIKNASSNIKIITRDNRKLRLVFYKSQKNGLILGALVNDRNILNEIRLLRLINLFSVIPIMLLIIFFTRRTHKDIISPIHKIVDGMNKVQNNDFSIQLNYEKDDEFSFLFNQFNSMTEQLNMLIREVYIQSMNCQKVQLKLLQSQINPHFLYNCLNFVYRNSMHEGNKIISEMTLYLSRYFRYATRIDNDTTPLTDEMLNIDDYIKIQQFRFPDMIIYENELSESIMKIKLPRLIVQPLVENAVIHAMERRGKSCCIIVRGFEKEDYIYIIVEDNGLGMTKEKLAEIKEKLKDVNSKGSGFGLVNTHWRLKLKYGAKSGIRIENKNNSGLRVTLMIRINEEQTDV